MKYSLNMEGFKPVEFLENHLVTNKIISIKDLNETKIKATIENLKYGLHHFNHINIELKNLNKIVFLLKKRQEKLYIGIRHNNTIEIGFNCKEYTNEDIKFDESLIDLNKKYSNIEKSE